MASGPPPAIATVRQDTRFAPPPPTGRGRTPVHQTKRPVSRPQKPHTGIRGHHTAAKISHDSSPLQACTTHQSRATPCASGNASAAEKAVVAKQPSHMQIPDAPTLVRHPGSEAAPRGRSGLRRGSMGARTWKASPRDMLETDAIRWLLNVNRRLERGGYWSATLVLGETISFV